MIANQADIINSLPEKVKDGSYAIILSEDVFYFLTPVEGLDTFEEEGVLFVLDESLDAQTMILTKRSELGREY